MTKSEFANGNPIAKSELATGFDMAGTLTNERTYGLTDDHQDTGAIPAVLNAVEPVECTCFVTPERYWFTHFGAVEPGSQLEPNPDCQFHFPSKWLIRKRIFRWTGELAWSVEHPSLPAYFGHRLHLNSFEDAVEYACDKARALAVSS